LAESETPVSDAATTTPVAPAKGTAQSPSEPQELSQSKDEAVSARGSNSSMQVMNLPKVPEQNKSAPHVKQIPRKSRDTAQDLWEFFEKRQKDIDTIMCKVCKSVVFTLHHSRSM
jgi:hypothetical protein